MVINIDERTLDSFLPLIPNEIKGYVEEDEEAFCLGAVRDDTAVGILIFSVSEGLDKFLNPVVMAGILWVETAESYRDQGVAGELLDAMSEVLADSKGAVFCGVLPLHRVGEHAEEFFASRGFDFEIRPYPVMVINKEDCRRQIREVDGKYALAIEGERKKPDGIIPVSDIPRSLFRKTLKRMLSDEDFKYYYNLSYDADLFDPGTSFAIMHDREITSMILFRRVTSDELHMVMFDALESADAKEMLSLLHYSAGCYYLNEPENAKVILTLWKEKSMKLATYIFPHKETYSVRRGYLSEDRG